MPSEALSLRWQDIDWESGRIIITSPKTENQGKASRTIPMFPELRTILDEAFELAPKGAVYVVDERMRASSLGKFGWRKGNLRTTFEKIVNRAGLIAWPRLFHNLRASRETELVEKYPLQVVTEWLGNTPRIAMRHYLMTTDEHFESAIKGDDSLAETAPDCAAQNSAQQAHAGHRGESQAGSVDNKKPRVLRGSANSRDTVQVFRVAGAGFEPTTSRL